MRKNSVVVRLAGGLGNQLFQYFAGQYVAHNNATSLVIDIRNLTRSTLENETIETIKSFKANNVQFINNLKRNHLGVKCYKKVLEKTHLNNRHATSLSKFSRNYFDKGYFGEPDKLLKILKPPIVLNGYYQNFYFYDNLSLEVKSLELNHPSDWFKSNLDLLHTENPIVIHVRRGDYRGFTKQFGLLNFDYYKSAINLALEKRKEKSRIWVFSDEIEKVKIEFNGLSSFAETRYVSRDRFQDASEVLMLMSKAKDLIVANSMFSLWAAKINERKNVYCASEIFYDKRPVASYPPINWNVVKSSWL